MAKRDLDMLPLLDVFMVVLFVFATIQEGQLDDSVQELEEASARALEAEASAAAASVQTAALAAELETSAAEARSDARREAELEAELAAYRDACGPRRPDGPVCPAADPESRELAEVAVVHQQLLAKVAVFEIEIGGHVSGDIRYDHCCFRRDPPQGEWRSCGVIPTGEVAREQWFDAGADGLVDGLRETRDGYAVVLLEQDREVNYEIGKQFRSLLNERFDNHYVYDSGIAKGPLQCPLLPSAGPSPSPETDER